MSEDGNLALSHRKIWYKTTLTLLFENPYTFTKKMKMAAISESKADISDLRLVLKVIKYFNTFVPRILMDFAFETYNFYLCHLLFMPEGIFEIYS